MRGSMLKIAQKYVKGEENLRSTINTMEKMALHYEDDERKEAVNIVIEHYFEKFGKMMDGTLLEKLTDVLLADDIQPTEKPIREYNFLSERQIRTRTDREVSDKAAPGVAIDGKDYSLPIRKRIR